MLIVAAGVIAVLTLISAFALRARHDPSSRLSSQGFEATFHDARVLEVDPDAPCPGGPPPEEASAGNDGGDAGGFSCPRAVVRLLQGPDTGEEVSVELPSGVRLKTFSAGDKVVVADAESAEPGFRYSFVDRQRKPVLLWLALGFAAVVIALAGLRGLAALAGLAASLVVLLSFVLPAVLDGQPPLPVAVVGAAIIAYLALYLAHGFRMATTVALLGTLGSLLLTAVLALIVTQLAGLTGFSSEEATLVQLADSRIDLTGLVLAGVVIGALGAIDDMTVTQVSAVSELHRASPGLRRRDLYAAALRIGRDHVASTVNTLALAYAGASLPLMLLFVLTRQSLGTVANGEVVATEIVRTLVGSIGLVASVPITTWLAVRVIPAGASEPSASGD